MQQHTEHHRLIRKLESLVDLSAGEKEAVLRLPLMMKELPENADIVKERDRPSECRLLVDGLACRYKLTPEGKRQIMSFHIAGDVPDVQSLHLKVMDHSIGTLTPCRVAFTPHQALRDLIGRHPQLGDAFWRDSLIDAAVFREWMLGLGRRTASQRVAHVLCEMLVRHQAVGLTHDHSYDFPITQAELGDALGLSTVHVKRSLQGLRKDGLVEMGGGRVRVIDLERLQAAGEFDPTYLHLHGVRTEA